MTVLDAALPNWGRESRSGNAGDWRQFFVKTNQLGDTDTVWFLLLDPVTGTYDFWQPPIKKEATGTQAFRLPAGASATLSLYRGQALDPPDGGARSIGGFARMTLSGLIRGISGMAHIIFRARIRIPGRCRVFSRDLITLLLRRS